MRFFKYLLPLFAVLAPTAALAVDVVEEVEPSIYISIPTPWGGPIVYCDDGDCP